MMNQKSVKKYVFQKGAAGGIPVSGTFELTPRCNFNCRMCYIHMSEKEQRSAGRELTAEEWIALGRQAVKEGMVYLLLTGGEPLLRPDFFEIYTALIQMGLMITINTNGSLIDEKAIACFKKYPPERVNITLYGASDDTYGRLCGCPNGYQRAVKGILGLKRAGIRVNLNTTYTKLNLPDMEKIVSFAKREEISIRMAGFVFPPTRSGHEETKVNLTAEEMGKAAARFDALTLEKEKIAGQRRALKACLEGISPEEKKSGSRISSCMAGRGAFWISWDGKMYPCGMLSGYTADVCGMGFAKSWQSMKEQAKTILLPEECMACSYQKCCPSCAAVSATVNNQTDAVVEALCIRTKTYVNHFLKITE